MLGDAFGKKTISVADNSSRLRDTILEHWSRRGSGEPPVRDEMFRASSLGKLCPRLYALAVADNFSIQESFEAEKLWIFGIGTAYHSLFQSEILPAIPEGVFRGWWERLSSADQYGQMFHGGSIDAPGIAKGWRDRPNESATYVEMTGVIPEYRFSGHWDGVLVWDDFTEIFELKSINERGFARVDPFMGFGPREDHIEQVHAYMWMSGLDRARIVYALKGDKGIVESVAEHPVLRDEKIVNGIKSKLNVTIQALDDVYEAIDCGAERSEMVIPDRLPKCDKKSAYRTKYCPGRDYCFPKRKKKTSK